MELKIVLPKLAPMRIIVIGILIVQKITLVNYFDYKWMCSYNFIESEMKLGHGKFGSLLQPHNDLG